MNYCRVDAGRLTRFWTFAGRKVPGFAFLGWLSGWAGNLPCSAAAATAGPDSLSLPRPLGDELPLSFWDQHRWLILVVSAAVLVGLAALALAMRRPRKLPAPEPPYAIARSALEALRARPVDGSTVSATSHAVKQYVMAVFALGEAELTSAELERALESSSNATPELRSAIAQFLRRCDEWKFAPLPPDAQFRPVETGLELIQRIENESRKPALSNPLPT
jgi:hypothetical protein